MTPHSSIDAFGPETEKLLAAATAKLKLNGHAINDHSTSLPTMRAPSLPLQPRFDNLPSQLIAVPQWVEQRQKRPFMPSGRPASSTNPQTWSPFTAVVDAYRRGGFDGIGFVFAGQHWGLDYDHVTDAEGRFLDADIEKEVRHLIAAGAYAERSPSGTGVHVIGRYTGDPVPGRKQKPREAYTIGRYFMMTGVPVPGVTR